MANCKSSFKATVCIVDSKSNGYQCNYGGQTVGYFLPFDQGKNILCTSPYEIEDFLKACKLHENPPLRLCSYTGSSFFCETNGTLPQRLEVADADNYACLSENDFKRLRQRCASSHLEEIDHLNMQ